MKSSDRGHKQITELFPELFIGVPEAIVCRIQSNIGSARHEGYDPRRPDIEQLIALETGAISHADAIADAKRRFSGS